MIFNYITEHEGKMKACFIDFDGDIIINDEGWNVHVGNISVKKAYQDTNFKDISGEHIYLGSQLRCESTGDIGVVKCSQISQQILCTNKLVFEYRWKILGHLEIQKFPLKDKLSADQIQSIVNKLGCPSIELLSSLGEIHFNKRVKAAVDAIYMNEEDYEYGEA